MRLRHTSSQSGVALITTVIVVAVLAVVAVAFMQSTTVDRLSSRSVANYTRAKLAAEAGAAVSQAMLPDLIRRYPDSITVWQNIGGGTVAGTNNEATVLYVRAQSANTNLGASPAAFGPAVTFLAQPLVSRVGPNLFSINTNLLPLSSVVSSVPLVAGTSVNINATNASRTDPFVGSRSATNPGAPVTAAQWIYMTNSQGQTNARYAFWVEDESFKVDVNTVTNGARGATSLGLSPAEVRLDGSLQSSLNTAIRNINAGNVIGARGSLPGSVFPSAATAALAGGLSSVQASPEFRFLTTAHSRSLNLSRAGFKRFDINTLANGLPGAARENLDRFIAALTNSNSIPNFGQRFYRLANTSSGINNTNAVSTNHSPIYLQKTAANLIDYLDTDDQPTVINNDANFSLRSGKPTFGIEALGGGLDGSNSVAAMGIEVSPRLQEYAIHGRIRRMDPIGYNTNSVPADPAAEYEISIDHYFEFWNPGTRDITLNNAFLKIYDQPRFGNNISGALASEGRPTSEIPVDGVVFPAGQVTVLTTAPTNEINSQLVGANASRVISLTTPNDDRVFTGLTRDVSTHDFAGFNRLFSVSLRPRQTSRTDYESAVLLGNNNGIVESFVGLPLVVSGGNFPALHFEVRSAAVQGTIGNLTNGNIYFVRGGSLRGWTNADAPPHSTEGDPRALNEQLSFRIYADDSSFDQTRFFSSDLGDANVPARSTVGAPNADFVRPTNWADFSSISAGAANAPLVIRNGPLQTIGELGHLTDPAKVPGTVGSLTDVIYSRSGGRTLRIGQPELPRWYDGNQTNASRTWTSWRLADVFTVTNALTITGAVNPNGILRDGGAAMRAALFDFRFQPSPDGATATASRAINTNNFLNAMVTRLTNATAAGLPAGSVNVFWERGEISELPLFNSGNTLASGVLMSNAFDRGREEVVRRSIEMITTRGSVFTVYAIGQSLQTTATSTNVLSTCRLKTTFELIPQFANPSQAFDDSFSPANAANRFVAPTNYQVRIISSQYD